MATETLELEIAIAGFQEFVRAMGKIEEQAEKTSRTWVDSSGKTRDELGRFTNGVDDAGEETKKFSGIVENSLSVALGNVLSSAINIAIEGLVNLGQAAVGAFTSSIEAAATFESSMADLSIAAKAAGVSMEDLETAALNVGGASELVGIDAQQAADSMTELYKSGLTTDQIFGDLNATLEDGGRVGGALRAAIDLAASSELDLAQATEVVTVSMATFGSEMETEAEQAAFITDAMEILVKTADASNASVSDLTAGLKNVAPTAVDAGMSIEDTAAALSILNDAGIKGEQAGTALNQMLISLRAPTDQAKDALSDLGVKIFDAEGNMREFPDIIRDYTDAMFGAKEVTVEVGGRTAEQNELLKDAQKQYDRAADKIHKHNEGLKTLTEKQLKNTNKEMADASKVMARLNGITGELTTTTKTLTEAQQAEANAAIFTVEGMRAISTITNRVNEVNEEGVDGWDQTTKAISEAATMHDIMAAKTQTLEGRMESFEGVIETLQIQIGGPFLDIFSKVLEAFTGFVENIAPSVEEVIIKVAGVIDNLVSSFLELVNAFAQGEVGIDFPWEDIFPESIANVIYGIIDVVKFLQGTLTEMSPSILAIRDNFASMAQRIASFVLSVFDKFSKWFKENQPLIRETFVDAAKVFTIFTNVALWFWSIVEPILSGLIDIILEVATLIMEVAQGDWTAAWESIKSIVGIAWEAIKAAFGNFLSFVANIFGTTWQEVVSNWSASWEQFKEIVSLAWDKIKEAVSSAFNSVKEFVVNTAKSLVDTWKGNWELFKTIVSTVWNKINKLVGDAIEMVRHVISVKWEQIKESIREKVEEIKGRVLEILTALFERMGLDLDEFTQRWRNIWENIKIIIATKFNEIKASVTQKVIAIRDAVVNKMIEIRDAIVLKMTEIITKWVEKWGEVKTKLETAFTNMVNAAKLKMGEILTAITDKIGEIETWIFNNTEKIKKWGEDIVVPIIDGIKAKAEEVKTAIKTVIEGISTKIGAMKKTIEGYGTSIIDKIIDGIKASSLVSAIQTLLDGIKTSLEPGGTLLSSLFNLGVSMLGAIKEGLISDIGLLLDALTDMIEQIIADLLPGGDPPKPNTTSVSSVGDPQPTVAQSFSALSSPLRSLQATVSPLGRATATNVNNMANNTTNNSFNLNMQSMVDPNELRFVFEDMAMSQATR